MFFLFWPRINGVNTEHTQRVKHAVKSLVFQCKNYRSFLIKTFLLWLNGFSHVTSWYHACILVISEEYWILRFIWIDSVSVERSKVMLNPGNMTGTVRNRQNQVENAGSLMKWWDAVRCWQCLWSVYRIWYCGWVWHPSNRAAVDRTGPISD